MKKFSAGGAQGRYDRRMADIEKDYKKAMARKTGKAAEVAEAKRQQRIADAKDDLAKRTGADRTATRAAERTAESNLTKTRKYGAAKSVTKDTAGPTGKVTDTLGAITPLKSDLATPAKKTEVKKTADKPKPSAADTARNKFFQDSLKKANFKRTARLAEAPIAPSKFDKAAFDRLKAARGDTLKTEATKSTDTTATGPSTKTGVHPNSIAAKIMRGDFFKTSDAFKASQEAKYGKAKGGKIMKYAKGGSTASQPMPPKKKPKEPITGGANTVPLTPERKEFLKELAKRNAKPGMAKGGKAKSFAATKFGKAMVKKSADTKGRAMVKKAGGGKCYASGGLVAGHKSADGIAKKGKTKGTMATMARGGSAKMRGRDSYGGAQFKKGGSC
jgi:hypothetical protein